MELADFLRPLNHNDSEALAHLGREKFRVSWSGESLEFLAVGNLCKIEW